MYYYYCLVTLGIRPWWKKFVTVFQIIQFTSGAFFTVSFYILYFKDLRVMETNSSYSISFTKGCSGELTSVIRENPLLTATLPHKITIPCPDTPFLRLQSLAANFSCGPTERMLARLVFHRCVLCGCPTRCSGPDTPRLFAVVALINLSFLFLFVSFYTKTYSTGRKSKTA